MKHYVFPNATKDTYDVVRRGVTGQESYWVLADSKMKVEDLTLDEASTVCKIMNGNKEIPWELIARDLMSLAETIEFCGDYPDGTDIRARLKEECKLSDEQLDELGV